MDENREVPGMGFLDTKTDARVPFEKTAIYLTEQSEAFKSRMEELKGRAGVLGEAMAERATDAGRRVAESPVGDLARWIDERNQPIAHFFNEEAISLTQRVASALRGPKKVEYADGTVLAELPPEPKKPKLLAEWVEEVAQKLDPMLEPLARPLTDWYNERKQRKEMAAALKKYED